MDAAFFALMCILLLINWRMDWKIQKKLDEIEEIMKGLDPEETP